MFDINCMILNPLKYRMLLYSYYQGLFPLCLVFGKLSRNFALAAFLESLPKTNPRRNNIVPISAIGRVI